MRRIGALFATVALCACSAAPVEVTPDVGDALEYVQTFRLSDRTSGGEELPNVRIERRVTVTCTAADAESSTLAIDCGDVSVWLDEDDAEPDFVATELGAATRAFDEESSSLSRMYAALWATTAHLESQAVIDRNGVIVELISGIEEIRLARGDDPSADLGGSFLESLVDDPVLLLFGSAKPESQPLRFRLEQWSSSFQIAPALTRSDRNSFEIAYESVSGAERDGPFLDLALRVTGTGDRIDGSGLLQAATLQVEVSAEVPVGAAGTTRRDVATLDYELARASR